MRKVRSRNMLFIVTSLYGGGAEKVCCLLASAMAETCPVTIAYFTEREGRYPIDPRCEVIRIPKAENREWIPSVLRRTAGRLDKILFIRKVKKERNIGVSVSFLLAPCAVNVFSRCGDRIITTERANPTKYQADRFWVTRILYALADHVVFQSREIQSLYGPLTRRHSSIIGNPVSVACRALPERSHRIVTLGRLTAQKNQAMLIRSFEAFHRTHPDYTLSIYGEGQLRGELQAMIEERGLGESVFLEGNRSDVHTLIRDAEIFVLASDYEGLSNALLECMTMGIACISTDCEGSTDVIRDGENGLLVRRGDEKGLTEAMCRLADEPLLRQRLEERAAADAEAFTPERIVRKWEAVFFEDPNI